MTRSTEYKCKWTTPENSNPKNLDRIGYTPAQVQAEIYPLSYTPTGFFQGRFSAASPTRAT